MTKRLYRGALLGALIASFTLVGALASAAPGDKPAPKPAPKPEAVPCSATLEVGKKYHWVTYENGQPQASGYVLFTAKKFGKWHKVEHVTDKPRAKQGFWGFFDERMVSFKSKAAGERWTAWMKVCEGAKINGNVYKGGSVVRQFTIVTDKVRN
jgi:hypothetical protein